MSDIIFHELHEYHKEMWDFLANNPYKTKENFLELNYDTEGYVNEENGDYICNDSFYELIENNAACFACVFADLILCERSENDPKYTKRNLCFYCPVTEWRETAIATKGTCTCLEYETSYGRFRLYSDEIDKEYDIEKAAVEVRDMEWSIPEGEEI